MNLLPLIVLLSCSSPAPESKSDNAVAAREQTPGQNDEGVRIHPVRHASMVLQRGDLTVCVDPAEGAERFKTYPAPDLILITDIHGDHMDPKTLSGLDRSKARIVAPQAVIDQLPEELRKISSALVNGASMDFRGIGIEAVPMYNLPESPDAHHTKGRGNGYVLSWGGQRIYISGDTEDIPEMRALKDIDIAFVCMNLPYTMTVDQAASGVLAFKPRVVYPYHYRGTDGFSDVARFKQLVNAGDPSIEVRMEDWYRQ